MSSSCNVDALCPYYRQSNIVPLPVELLDFTAEVDQEKIICKWSTASETNNAYFEIQRSEEMLEGWKIVGTMQGAGKSSSVRSYEFVDKPDVSQYSTQYLYYRLKQVDFNGNFSFSKTIAVKYIRSFSASIFPNPFSNNVKMVFDREEKNGIQIEIEDVFGRSMFNTTIALETPRTTIELDLSFLNKGIYLVKLSNGIAVQRYKIIKS
jgi:hypothetical protein